MVASRCTTGASLKWATLVVLLGASVVCGGERKGRPKLGDYNPQDDSVEMFAAIQAGQIEVKFIPRDSTQARILIANKTGKPLNVELPEVFVGVPVLAQVGQNPFGANQQGGNQRGGGNQSLGGGANQGNQNQLGNGQNFFNVPAEKVGQLRVACVCLEHGKGEPRAAIPYEVRPLDSFSTDPALHELLRLLATGEHSQHVVQAAAWHLSDGMSWKELAAKRTSALNGVGGPYFTHREVEAATRLVEQARERAQDVPAASSTVTQAALAE